MRRNPMRGMARTGVLAVAMIAIVSLAGPVPSIYGAHAQAGKITKTKHHVTKSVKKGAQTNTGAASSSSANTGAPASSSANTGAPASSSANTGAPASSSANPVTSTSRGVVPHVASCTGPAPCITVQPSPVTVCSGGTAMFTSTAINSAGALWQYSTDAGVTWNAVVLGTDANATFSSNTGIAVLNVTAGTTNNTNGTLYRVIFNHNSSDTNPNQLTTSNSALLTIGGDCTPVPPTITNTPVPPTITNTPVPPTITNTPVPPTITNTPVPPTPTNVPPTSPNDRVVAGQNPWTQPGYFVGFSIGQTSTNTFNGGISVFIAPVVPCMDSVSVEQPSFVSICGTPAINLQSCYVENTMLSQCRLVIDTVTRDGCGTTNATETVTGTYYPAGSLVGYPITMSFVAGTYIPYASGTVQVTLGLPGGGTYMSPVINADVQIFCSLIF